MPALLEEKLSDLWNIVRTDSPQRHVRAAEIASDIYSLCIEQITETELFYRSSVLLNEKNGIVKFLHESATLDEFANCKEELLHLLNVYVKSVGHKILPYAIGIKDVCVSLFSKDRTAKVKNAIFPLLIAILELCGKSDVAGSLNIPKIVEKFFQAALQPTKHTSTVRCGIYHLLGVLCQQFPECMIDYSTRLIGIYTRTLKAEMITKKAKKPELPVIAGCLRGLTAYLYSFTQSAAEGSVYAQDIYNFARRAIDPEAALTRYDVPKAGLALLAEHAEQFKEYMAKDTEEMYSSLCSWCSHNNRECKLAGLKAMESFLKQVSNQIAESGDRETSVRIYREFMRRFRLIIDNPNAHHKELAVAIKGYGFFARPCKVYGTPEDLQYMFSEMVQRSEQLFFANLEETTVEEVLFNLPTFMQALASITAEIEELPDGFRLSLERLVVLMFEYYPRLPKHIILQSGVALLRLIMAVSTKPMTSQQFLSHIVFQGLVRSCSHPVVIEAGDGSAVVSLYQSDQEEASELYKVASYKDYIEIWSQMMDPKKLKGIGGDYTTHELRQAVHLSVYNEFIQATLSVIKKLDLSASSSAQAATEEPTSSEGAVERLSSDPIAGLQPTVPRDFQIFINLVELCRKILPSVTPHLFTQWVFIFSKEVVAIAAHYPLVSGFYKLLACVLDICKKNTYFEGVLNTHKSSIQVKTEVKMEPVAMETELDNDKNLCFLLFRKFIREVVVRMQQYKDDLLSSCLQLVLSIPSEMVQSELDSLIPAVELSLKLGVGYLPLAKVVMDALESWLQLILSEKLYYIVARVLPLLTDYLQTSAKTGHGKDSSDVVAISATSSRSSRGRKLPTKVMKQWKEGMEASENDLNKIREQILFLLGSLGGVVNKVLLERESSGAVLCQAVSWDSKKKLEFPIPFSDMKPTIYIDPFLPRVCELAVSSSDRQTKVAACEFLHAAVLFILGKSAQQALQKKSPMTKLFKRVFPFLLQLGCDVERVAEQLFRPLVLQMIHWFTRNTQYESPDTMALLDAILEGMEHPTNTSLRDFCAQCVKEFLLWSIKQTSKKQQEHSPINTKSLLKRIYSMASHPSATKRLGAALALNSIYTVFREEEALVDMFVIEMLVVMINSLKVAHRDNTSLGTVDQCKQSIGHIAKIIRAKSALLCSPSKNRRVPRGLKGAELSQLIVWLLSQSGCPETEARQQCIQLFTMFAPLASKVHNTRVWIRRTIESEGGIFFVSRFEKGSSGHGGGIAKNPTLTKAFSLPEALKWLDNLQAALDSYIWVLKDQLVSPSEVFNITPADKNSNLFTSLQYFLSNVALKTFEATLDAAPLPDERLELSPLEEDQYDANRSSVVSRILCFSEILLIKHTSESISSTTSPLWDQPLWNVLFTVVFDQPSVGLHKGDFSMVNSIIDKAVNVFRAIAEHFPEDLKQEVIQFFGKRLSEKPYNLIDRLPVNLSEKMFVQEHSLVDKLTQGYLCLAEGNLLKQIMKYQGVDVSQTLNLIIVNVLAGVSTTGSESEQKIGDPAKTRTMELLLKLALFCADNDVLYLVQVILCQKKGSENGLLLYLEFSDVLNSKLVRQTGPVITTLMGYAPSLPYAVCTVLNGMVDYILKDKLLRKQKLPEFCSVLMCNWHQLSSWWTDKKKSSDTKLAAIGLLQKVLSAQPKFFETIESKELILDVVDMYCQLVSDPNNSLNFKSKVLEVLTPFLNISNDVDTKIRASLNTLVSNQFPLKSSELPQGSPMYNEYISVLDKLLESLVSSGSLLLLELIIGIACREERHAHEENILSSLAKFVNGLSDSSMTKALNLCYEMFTNERDYPPEARRGIGERVCCNLLRECSRSALVDFFVVHITEIMEKIEEKPLRTSDPKLEGQLISKMCCFQFMEVLYIRLTSPLLSSMDSKVNASYCKGSPSTGKELTQAITKLGHAAKSEDLHGDKTLYELRRQYHCHAYNMLMAVISCTQTKPQFYVGFLFKEDVMKGQYLFDNIIDSEKEYRFEIELETPMKRRKQLLTIRDELLQSRKSSPDSSSSSSSPFGPSPPFPVRYISSVYLAESSLSTDVSQYDFTFSIGRVPTHSDAMGEEVKASSYIVSEEHLEEDPLNSHECMVPMMRLLDHMEHNKVTPVVEEGLKSPEMPPWMCQLHKKLSEGSTETNVRLFIARLVVNRPKVFQPYAKHWLPSLTQLVISGNHGGAGLHYFVVDLIATMLSWTPVAVLEDRYLASRLMEYVVNHCDHENKSVFRNNLEITRTLIECWKDFIQVPTKLIFNYFSYPDQTSKSNRTGIQLLGIIVANGLPPFDQASAGSVTEQRYYTSLTHNMSNKYREVYGAAAEVVGMLLSYNVGTNNSFKDQFQEIVTDQLLALSQEAEQSEDRFIICLHKIQLHYPKIVQQRFVDKLLFMLPMLQGVFRSNCLEILQSQADIQPQFYRKLKDVGFHNMISHRDEATQLASLKIVQGMLNQLDMGDIRQLLPYLTAFAGHSSIHCRITMYNVLMNIYNSLCSQSDIDISEIGQDAESILTSTRDQLLAGLSDSAEEIRLKMYEFWNQDSNLAPNTLGRLSQILATLYSTKTEQHFLYHATNLLLELTSRSPDFNRSIFDTPLSECKFEDYKSIDLSWHQRHLQMTPLFAATQASQTGSQPDSAAMLGMGTGMLRATQQSLAFTPTQDVGGYSWMAPAAQSMDVSSASFTIGTTSQSSDAQPSSLLFTRPSTRPPLKAPLRIASEKLGKSLSSEEVSSEEARRREVMKLKRRFLKSRETTSAYFARSEARKKIMREEHRKHQRAARQSHVVMYRKYRDGELPDIQIKHSEIIRPLQALAQHDSALARLLFGSLFNAIFTEVDLHLKEDEADSMKKAIRDGINTVLGRSTQYFSPFVGSLQDICYHESQLSLTPSVIANSSLVSKQELIGILLLEKQLLVNVSDSSAKSAKRSRGTQEVSEVKETWVEASRLYKSLSDFDIVHGIFSNLDGIQEITRKALEAEERGDYLEALGFYKQAIGTPGESWATHPTQVEEDLWEDSLLACYDHLSQWQDLETASTHNIDDHTPPRLDAVWEDAYYKEHYLPYILRSKVKLWSMTGKDDGGVEGFLEKTFQNEDNRLVMESRYPDVVLMAYIMKGDMDRAQYYLSLSLQAFQQEWSTAGGDQLSYTGCKEQCLQQLTEIKEFLNFLKHTGNDYDGRLACLLGKWRDRYPDPKLDSILIWDDIITNRYVMLKKMSKKLAVNRGSEMMEVEDGGGVVDMTKLLSLEYTHMCMKIADAACIQSNFPVAKKYLHMVEKSIKKDFADDQLLQLQWLHSVANMRLQQMYQDRSPSRCDTIVSLAHKLEEFQSVPILSENRSVATQHHSIRAKTLNLLAEIFSTEEDGSVALSTLSSDVSKELRTLCGFQSTESLDPAKVAKKLWCQVISSLNSSIKSGTQRSALTGKIEPNVTSLEEMAAFCDEILHKEDEEEIVTGLETEQFPSVVIAHTLKAMSLGSKKALETFPRLLKLVEKNPTTKEQFVKKSTSVPCWMFIGWISQIVALLDKEEGDVVAEILFKIADTYPQALSYPFKVSASGFRFANTPRGKQNRSNFEKLREKLRNHLLDDFVAAVDQLNSPELVCKDFLDEIKHLLLQSKKEKAAIEEVWKMLSAQLLEEGDSPSSLYGTPSLVRGMKLKAFYKTYNKKITDTFGKDGSKIHTMTGTQFNKHVASLFESMRPSLNKQQGDGLLKEYSPWLDSFQPNEYQQMIEVPGQYDGKSKPMPEYHAKIAGFDSKILVLTSIRKPKRLTIIGDNTKEYMFLVKGGEDLRHDQRIEQLFDVMNSVLCEDAACSQRQLKIRTYQVIPMTTRVGLIEWVKNTKPLKEFLTDELNDSEKKSCQNAYKWHTHWVERFGGYPEMYKKAKATEVEKEYRKKVAAVPWDLLRRAFLNISSAPEAFLLLRSHFIKTFATANICQYILGIGDRHLSNFMVDMEHGGIVPIDFGHAFHTATQFLPFPELMPMRLTPQLTNLCLPHKPSGQLRSCMIHTMRALQTSHSTLVNTMDVFINEPSVEWKNFARKQAAALKVGGGENESMWYPREKIRVSKKKLMGYNSSHLMLVDLKLGHQKKQEFKSLESILMGDKQVNLRACVKEECQSVEEQVDCLIDHATDPNILGRTYGGWEPWV